MLTTVARVVDLLALSFAFGSTVWFFFIQAPVLVRLLGRDRLVPLLMSLSVVLFRSLTVASVLMVAAAIAAGSPVLSAPVLTAALGFAGAAMNSFVVLPRALRTGGKSLKEAQTLDEQKSVGNFVSQGAGEASRFWHRAVVLFVVVMMVGLVPHAVLLFSQHAGAGEAHVGSTPSR